MENWIDLTKIIPGLNKGQWLHVVRSPLEPLVNILSENGFSVLVIDGSKINDSKISFNRQKEFLIFRSTLGKIGMHGMTAWVISN